MTTVKVSLWDGNDTASIEGQRTFASVDTELTLIGVAGVDFPPPNMTSNVLPTPYVASASDTNSTYYPFKAFDSVHNGVTDVWLTNSGITAGWIQIDLGSVQVKGQYSIYPPYQRLTRTPKTWTIKASNTGAFSGEEATIDTQTNIVGWTDNTAKTFVLSSPVQYRYYRLDVTLNSGDPDYLSVSGWLLEGDGYVKYDDSSPSPTGIWTAHPVGTVIDMSTFFVPENMNSGDVGSVKYRYSVNNGSPSSWLTQAGIQAESDPTITDATNSLKFEVQYLSDGTQKTTSQAYATIDVTLPSGGGKYDKFSRYGHRRIGA